MHVSARRLRPGEPAGMKAKRIVIVQGHPDAGGGHFGHALAAEYAAAARAAGHEVGLLEVARLAFPLVASKAAWEDEAPPPAIVEAQRQIAAADHLVIFYPLWLGAMPAVLKGFLEQVLRPGFAFPKGGPGARGGKPLAGKSARVVVTMGMPAFFYRWYFRAHSLKSLERNILGFVGIRPVSHCLVGMVEGKAAGRTAWLRKMAALGRRAA